MRGGRGREEGGEGREGEEGGEEEEGICTRGIIVVEREVCSRSINDVEGALGPL